MPWSDVKKPGLIPDNMRRNQNVIALAVVSVGIVLLVYAGAVLQQARTAPLPQSEAPISFPQDEYTPDKLQVCLGGSLEFDVTRTVRRTTIVTSVAKWYNRDTKVLVSMQPTTAPITPDLGVVHRLVPLPPEVDTPGRWELQQFVWEVIVPATQATPAVTSKVARYIVPFTAISCGR